jgi:hypothetical protein
VLKTYKDGNKPQVILDAKRIKAVFLVSEGLPSEETKF